MNDLPKCKLCGSHPMPVRFPDSEVLFSCTKGDCVLSYTKFSFNQWRTLMSGPTLRRLREGDVPNSDPMKIPLTAFYDPDGKEFIGYDTPQGADPSHIIENLPRPEEVE